MVSTHLVAYGLLGPLVLAVVLTSLGLGVGLVIVIVGVLFLALFAFAIAGVSRWEDLRVAGLFGIATRPHPLRRSTRTDGLRPAHTAWLQLTDGRNWLGLLHFTIITALGAAALWLLQGLANSLSFLIGSAISGDGGTFRRFGLVASGIGGVVGAVVFIVVSLAAMWALTVAHRSISVGMLAPSRLAELEQTAAAATKRRDDAVSSATIERSRLERDLHDGVQPRLVSVGMTLGMARAKLDSDPAAAAQLIEEAHTSTKAAITELRQLARGFHPAILEDRGLDAALSALAVSSHLEVRIDSNLTRRYSPATESAMYFVIAEGITNAAKHSGAAECRIVLRERPGNSLWARVEDDGVGGATRVPGGGIDGIGGRISAAGGTMSLMSPLGGPTTIEVSLPCES